jgi:hypothetical protein
MRLKLEQKHLSALTRRSSRGGQASGPSTSDNDIKSLGHFTHSYLVGGVL